jgi:hypothetical protein
MEAAALGLVRTLAGSEPLARSVQVIAALIAADRVDATSL